MCRNRNGTYRASVVASLLLIALAAASSMAVVPGALTDFQVTNSLGQGVSSTKIAPSEKWILIYIQPQCGPCRTALKMLSEKELPGVPAKTVLIVGGASVESAQAMAAAFPDLPSGQWYADPKRVAYTQLTLEGAPVVIGLQQNTIRWTLAGVNPDTDKFKSALTSWLQAN